MCASPIEEEGPLDAPLFEYGQIAVTPGVIQALACADGMRIFMELVQRHLSGDWGDLGDFDKGENEKALKTSARIFSSYKVRDNLKIWIITEADRSATTLLLPEEY